MRRIRVPLRYVGSLAGILQIGLMLQASAQSDRDLSVSPRLEAGYFWYLPPKNHSSSMRSIPVKYGLDLSAQFIPAWSLGLTVLVGSREYEERFRQLGADYLLLHKYYDLTARLQSIHRIEIARSKFWEVSYGLARSVSVSGDIAITTSRGQSAVIYEREPNALGLTTAAIYGWGNKRPVRVGLIGDLLLVQAREFSTPWPRAVGDPRRELVRIGQPRIFAGLCFSVALLNVPLRNGKNGEIR